MLHSNNYFASQQPFVKKPGLFGNLVQYVANRHITTDSMVVTGNPHGDGCLDQILKRLDELLSDSHDEALLKEAAAMRYSLADAVELAYTNWNAFCHQWEVEIYYHLNHLSSGIYVFYFKELTGNKRQYHFKFSGL